MERNEDKDLWFKILRPPCFGDWNCLILAQEDSKRKEGKRMYKLCSPNIRHECQSVHIRRRKP